MLNRWNELGGVKFSLTLIGEQPLQIESRGNVQSIY